MLYFPCEAYSVSEHNKWQSVVIGHNPPNIVLIFCIVKPGYDACTALCDVIDEDFRFLLLNECIVFSFFYPQHVHNFINQTWRERYNADISQDVLTLIWSTIVSTFTVGGFIGVTVGGTLSVKMGRYELRNILQKPSCSFYCTVVMSCCLSRKGTLLTNNSLALTAALLMGLSYPTGLFELLIVGRLFTGINAGKKKKKHSEMHFQTFLRNTSLYCMWNQVIEVKTSDI